MASAASEASKASRLVSQLRRHARGGNRPAAAAAGQELDRLCGSSPAASRRALAEGGMEAVAEYIAAELRQQPARAPSSSGLDAAAHVVVSLVNHCGGEAHAAALACRLIPGLVAMLNCGGLPRDAAPVQRAAAAALSYLTEYSRECSGAVLGERGGAVSRLVQLLSLSSDECSFEAAMCTLNNLMVCSGEEAKQAFVDAGGLTAMTNELSMPSGMPATTGMLIPACSAAARLASSPGSHAEALAACGAIPALVRLLRHQDTVVAAQASDALFNLAQSSPERCAATLEAGAIPPLLHLLRRPAESPTNLAASKVLHILASTLRDACRLINQLGGLTMLQHLMAYSGGTPELQCKAAELVAVLDGFSATERQRTASGGAQQAAAAPATAAPPRVCAGPGCTATRSLRRCGGCGTVHYCSERCRDAAWPDHKAECRRLQAEAAEASAAAEAAVIEEEGL